MADLKNASDQQLLHSLLARYNVAGKPYPTKEVALRRAACNGNAEDIKALLEYGTLINSQDDNPKSRKTALHWAIIFNQQEIATLLTSSYADATIKDASGKTASQYDNKISPAVLLFSKKENLEQKQQLFVYDSSQKQEPLQGAAQGWDSHLNCVNAG